MPSTAFRGRILSRYRRGRCGRPSNSACCWSGLLPVLYTHALVPHGRLAIPCRCRSDRRDLHDQLRDPVPGPDIVWAWLDCLTSDTSPSPSGLRGGLPRDAARVRTLDRAVLGWAPRFAGNPHQLLHRDLVAAIVAAGAGAALGDPTLRSGATTRPSSRSRSAKMSRSCSETQCCERLARANQIVDATTRGAWPSTNRSARPSESSLGQSRRQCLLAGVGVGRCRNGLSRNLTRSSLGVRGWPTARMSGLPG